MPALVELHTVLGRSFMFFALALGLWGMVMYFTRQSLGPSYWGALVIGEIVAVLQGLLGVIQLVAGGQPGRLIHILYGSLSVLVWPAIFGYMRGQRESRNETFAYGLGSLFLFGLALRAFTTG
jgi:hypothetical protein